MDLGKIAVLKPDHLGDLVLASPAIRVLQERLGPFDLMIHPGNQELARFLFGGDISLKFVEFDHLTKNKQISPPCPRVEGYDTIVSLRQDDWIDLAYLKSCAPQAFVSESNVFVHETENQRKMVTKLVGNYEVEDYFYPSGKNLEVHQGLKKIGLCLSAGHSSNQWSLLSWIEIGQWVRKKSFDLHLIGGPQEQTEIAFISKILQISAEKIIVGSRDYAQFATQIQNLDLVIATDSGTAHLCSLWAPLISIFGPSPYRRFAPFGSRNKILSLDLNCSPCLQFSKSELNKCISRECMNSITPQRVFDQIMAHDARH